MDSIREIDIATRYGGEEFVVILPETTKQHGYATAEKIRRAVQDSPLETIAGKSPAQLTISAGVASLGDDGMGASELIAKADQAVYRAKEAGRNAVRLAS
jgi:diguanylate cyclase (GGDEF)-like protein